MPWGRFRYLRNPQGLISAGDEFNRRTDAAFEQLTNFAKVVDDCLAYDADFGSHIHHVREVLTCARKHGVTMSPSKFEFGVQEVIFVVFTSLVMVGPSQTTRFRLYVTFLCQPTALTCTHFLVW